MAVLEVIEEEQLVERANHIGQYFNQHLSALKEAHPALISDVRNQGAMIALELVENGDKETPNVALTQAIIASAAQHGLILLACGFHSNVIRFLPALTMTDEVMKEGLAQFDALFNSLV